MRKYAALYSSKSSTWSIIAQDDNDKTWFMYQEKLDSVDVAETIVEGLNKRNEY